MISGVIGRLIGSTMKEEGSEANPGDLGRSRSVAEPVSVTERLETAPLETSQLSSSSFSFSFSFSFSRIEPRSFGCSLSTRLSRGTILLLLVGVGELVIAFARECRMRAKGCNPIARIGRLLSEAVVTLYSFVSLSGSGSDANDRGCRLSTWSGRR